MSQDLIAGALVPVVSPDLADVAPHQRGRPGVGFRETTSSVALRLLPVKRTDAYAVVMRDSITALIERHQFRLGLRHRF